MQILLAILGVIGVTSLLLLLTINNREVSYDDEKTQRGE